MREVFEVRSTNIDLDDGVFCNVLFDTMEKAIDYCKEELKSKEPSNVTEDFEGTLTEFQGKSLEYRPNLGKPAIYYNSSWGKYRMVIYVQQRSVH